MTVGRSDQRVIDVVGIGGLGEIVDRAELHGGDGGGDIAVAGQHHGARFRAYLLERGDDVDAVAVFEPHVHHGESRGTALERRKPVLDRGRGLDFEAARLHGARKPGEEGAVVVDDQERIVREQGGARLRHGQSLFSFHVSAALLAW